MMNIAAHDAPQGELVAGSFRQWMMALLTAAFVCLYGAALLGWIKPLTDDRLLFHLQPIIFVIIGYYFGRLPAQQNEQALRSELLRQAQKTEAAQHAKEQAQQMREALEEKLKNARVALLTPDSDAVAASARGLESRSAESARPGPSRHALTVALSILNS